GHTFILCALSILAIRIRAALSAASPAAIVAAGFACTIRATLGGKTLAVCANGADGTLTARTAASVRAARQAVALGKASVFFIVLAACPRDGKKQTAAEDECSCKQ
ncbi:MAG: hypothetical protein FWC40_09960, partial [Proteobacteria bacterium]|nr:hypothetical protein [Pseudomonadota bacterium]